MPSDPPEERDAGADVYDEYATRMRDELDLATEREEALRLERELDRATSRPVKDPAIPIDRYGDLAGPEEKKYQATMKRLSMGPGRAVGQGYNIAMIFVAYPVGGAIAGWLMDKYLMPRFGVENSWYLTLFFLIGGFYNGVLEMLRVDRKMRREADAEKAEKRSRLVRPPE